MGRRTWIGGWPAVRQLTGGDPLGRGVAAESRRTRALQARTETADRMVKVGVSVLRRGLRAAGLRPGRTGHPGRGRPRLPRLAWTAVPEGLGHPPAGHLAAPADEGPLPAPTRHRVGGPRPRHGDGDDRRPGARDAAAHLAGHRRGNGRCGAPWASPAWAGRRWTTRRTTSSRSSSPRSARSRSRTRPVFDTPPPSPVWGPASAAAAPPRSSRICRTPTAS